MLINKVSDDTCQWNAHDVVISIGGIFFIEGFVCCITKKCWAFSLVPERFPLLCMILLFVVNRLTVFLSFCYIYKDFVRKLKAFPPSLCHFCACEMSPGWGHLITWMDPSVEHLNGIFARVGGIWTIIFKKVKCPGVCPGGAHVEASIWPIHYHLSILHRF